MRKLRKRALIVFRRADDDFFLFFFRTIGHVPPKKKTKKTESPAKTNESAQSCAHPSARRREIHVAGPCARSKSARIYGTYGVYGNPTPTSAVPLHPRRTGSDIRTPSETAWSSVCYSSSEIAESSSATTAVPGVQCRNCELREAYARGFISIFCNIIIELSKEHFWYLNSIETIFVIRGVTAVL